MPASPQTTATAAELRQDLGAVAYERLLTSPERGYIAQRVLPIFESPVGAGKFPSIPKDVGLALVDDARAPGGNYNEIAWRFVMSAFDTVDRGLEGRVDDALLALYGNLLNAEEITVLTVTEQILLNMERRAAAKLEAGGAAANVGTEWSTSATATPRVNINAAKAAMRTASGLLPNAIAMSYTVFQHALATKELMDALQYTQPIQMGGFEAQRAALAMYFGVDEILVAGGVKNTANKGLTAVLADVWDDEYVHLLRVSDGGPNIMEPAYGRTILFTGDSPQILTTETYRDEPRRSQMVRVRNNVAEFTQYAAAKYTLGNISA